MAINILLCVMGLLLLAIVYLAGKLARLELAQRRQSADMTQQLLELETGYDDRIGRLEESTELDGLREEVVALRKEVETLHKQVDEAILPDDSTARKAKEQIDAFNAGVYNILSYHGRQRKPEVTDDDEE
jgi:cell division protein FtsB